MGDALRDMLLLFLTKNFLLSSSLCHVLSVVHSQWSVVAATVVFLLTTDYGPLTKYYFFPGAFFLAMVARLGPLRVRAFVWVRCPLTGNERRWRSPR